jgi:hypothetical protein
VREREMRYGGPWGGDAASRSNTFAETQRVGV